MKRYYFHLVAAGGDVLKDEEGSELPDFLAARNEATETAREIAAEAIKTGVNTKTEAILIADNEGQELYRVALTAVIPKSL